MNSTAAADLPVPDPEIPAAAGPGTRAVDRRLNWTKLTITSCLRVAAEMASQTLPAPDPEIPAAAGPGTDAVDRWLNWTKHTITFCLGVAAEMATQTRTEDPLSFHSLCLLLILALSAVFVATNIAPEHPKAAHLLESIGTLFGITGFFLVITVALPLALKLISWLIYALNLLSVCSSSLEPFLVRMVRSFRRG